jgi:hypothetical protein
VGLIELVRVVVRFVPQLVHEVALPIAAFHVPSGHLAASPFMIGVNHPGAAVQAELLVLKGGEVRPLLHS